MTRVVVQRGSGPANSSQSRPPSAPPSGSPSAPPSAPASSSSTPPLPYSQLLPSSSQFPLPSSSVSHSHSSGFFSSSDEGQDQITNEDQRFNDVVELQTLVPDTITETLASSSLLDARGSSGQVNLEGHVESTGALEAHGSEDLRAKLKEPELVSHLQHDPELERLQEAPDRQHLGVGEDAVRTAEIAKVAVDWERGDDSLENLSLCSEDLSVPFSAASTGQRKQEDGGTSTSSIPQGHYSSGQNVMQSSSPALMSTTFVPLSMPIPYPPLPVQSVTHSLPLPPLSGQYSPSLLAGAHPFPRSHEENDSGRPMGNPNVSEAIGCSYLSAPTPSVPFIPSSSSRRTRGGVTFRRIPRGLKGSRNSPNSSRPTSPRTYGEGDGYNSADEQGPWGSGSSGYEDNGERERQFENELRRVKNLEVRRMAEDGNCLFRSIADQIYGDAEMYSETRQMCIDYMEKERDHFSQFVTESFTAYCKRKRRDKVYGNNLEIQAMAEMYNRPIHIYSYSTEPINIFHGSYETDLPPIRLSYHRSNHYNSLLDPCNPAVGAGLGFGSLRGRNVDTEQVKAALKAQQEQQIDKALIAEGRFYSDMELTEQEIERMVMEASRAEFLAGESFRLQSPWQEETSTSAGAEPSSSGTMRWNGYMAAGSPRSTIVAQGGSQQTIGDSVSPPATSTGGAEEAVSSNVRMLLSMGFSYLQVMEAHSIFGDNVNNMLCYLLETETNGSDDGENVSRRKGKAAE